jgi:hypothetical protein
MLWRELASLVEQGGSGIARSLPDGLERRRVITANDCRSGSSSRWIARAGGAINKTTTECPGR